MDIFVGTNYLVTVHRFHAPVIGTLQDRWRENPALVEPNPLGFLLYRLADGLIEQYFPVADALEAKIARISASRSTRTSRSSRTA